MMLSVLVRQRFSETSSISVPDSMSTSKSISSVSQQKENQSIGFNILTTSLLLLAQKIVVGHIDICLCISLIPTFIQANVVAQAAVLLVGEAKVTALIEALVRHCDSL